MMNEKEFLETMELLNNDHFHSGYPCVQMRDINRLLEIITRQDAALTDQAKDYAQRHIGFAKELERLLGRIEKFETVISHVCASCRSKGKITLCEECEVARS